MFPCGSRRTIQQNESLPAVPHQGNERKIKQRSAISRYIGERSGYSAAYLSPKFACRNAARVQIQYPQTGDLNYISTLPMAPVCACWSVTADQGLTSTPPSTTLPRTDTLSSAHLRPNAALFQRKRTPENFNSIDSSLGVWRLTVENNGSDSRTGHLKDYSLTITGSPQGAPTFRSTTVLNTASVEPE